MLKSFGDARWVNLLVEYLGSVWKCACRIGQAAPVSVSQRPPTSPSFWAPHSFCCLEIALGFLITLTFISTRTRHCMGRPVIISEKWVLKIFSQGVYVSIYKILRVSELYRWQYRIWGNLDLQWLCLVPSPCKSPIWKDLLHFCISPLLYIYICSLV